MFHYWLAATAGEIGDPEVMRRQAKALLMVQPSFTIAGTARTLAVFRPAEVAQRFLEGLRKSGLPTYWRAACPDVCLSQRLMLCSDVSGVRVDQKVGYQPPRMLLLTQMRSG